VDTTDETEASNETSYRKSVSSFDASGRTLEVFTNNSNHALFVKSFFYFRLCVIDHERDTAVNDSGRNLMSRYCRRPQPGLSGRLRVLVHVYNYCLHYHDYLDYMLQHTKQTEG
jgi:hypothetical protein